MLWWLTVLGKLTGWICLLFSLAGYAAYIYWLAI
jgi:hypothetical protein